MADGYVDRRELYALYDHERATAQLEESILDLIAELKDERKELITALEDLQDKLMKLADAVERLTNKMGSE